MLRIFCVVVISMAGASACLHGDVYASQSVLEHQPVALDRQTLSEVQSLFYNGSCDTAAALTLELRSLESENLAAYELRTSALLFVFKATLGDQRDKGKVFKKCVRCPELMAAFLSDTARGQALARARLHTILGDEAALFFLGKLDLNYV